MVFWPLAMNEKIKRKMNLEIIQKHTKTVIIGFQSIPYAERKQEVSKILPFKRIAGKIMQIIPTQCFCMLFSLLQTVSRIDICFLKQE